MKKSEIVVGKTYSNGRGRMRKVVGIGPEYKFYPKQECDENMQYEIIADGTTANRMYGKRCNMTLASFASWAKCEVQELDTQGA